MGVNIRINGTTRKSDTPCLLALRDPQAIMEISQTSNSLRGRQIALVSGQARPVAGSRRSPRLEFPFDSRFRHWQGSASLYVHPLATDAGNARS